MERQDNRTMLFSQRKGLKPVRSVLQVDSVDIQLRNGLWNALDDSYWSKKDPTYELLSNLPRLNLFCHSLWRGFFKETVDSIPTSWPDALTVIKDYFFRCQWYEVYDSIEFVSGMSLGFDRGHFMNACNVLFESEMSAYRFVDHRIVQMTSEEEIVEIEAALADDSSYYPVVQHLRTALDLLSDRESPDYRNSIKESISAVESACNITTGSKATLGQALKALDDKTKVHPALRNAFSSLYGYTSDADGIRHGLLEEANLDFADAKFMLVVCSAFTNYLRSKASK